MKYLITFSVFSLFFQPLASFAQTEAPAVLPSEQDLKPVKKATIFDNIEKNPNTFKKLSPRVYLFKDTTETRSGYGVWWCSNHLGTGTWPNRVMFLAGLNQEGDYLLYYADRASTRDGSTQRFSPTTFKKNQDGSLEKIESEGSKISLKFIPKFKDGEMISIAFSYSSPNHQDFKHLTRESCEKY
jgi:hypothetical protein